VRLFDLPEALEGLGDNWSGQAVAGDIRSRHDVRRVLDGVGVVVHLAAVLPPLSEQEPDLTWTVNVDGTRTLLESLPGDMTLIFASSVATYGVPQTSPVSETHPQRPLDVYGKSKVEAESLVKASPASWTILRFAPIAVPEVLDLPDPWPFTREQDVEFVALQDAATAVVNAIDNPQARRRILNIAGGRGWQMTGEAYSAHISSAFDLDPSWATFREGPGWAGWYDTSESQAALAYQKTDFEAFIAHLRQLYMLAVGA